MNLSINKKNLITLFVVLVIVAGAFLGGQKMKREQGYSVVYLVTGEVYVGKLKTFPDLELIDSYMLQVSKDASDPNKNNFQLQPIKDALWAPKSLHFIKDSVVFYGPLLPTSKIAEALLQQAK